MRTVILPFEDWPLVEPIVTGVHENQMPRNPESSSFLMRMDGEKQAAVMHVETVYFFNTLYVFPEYRNRGVAAGLFLDALGCVPKGFSAIVFAEENKRRTWARYVKARDLGLCRVLRKDVPL